jgi:hypothetical protein
MVERQSMLESPMSSAGCSRCIGVQLRALEGTPPFGIWHDDMEVNATPNSSKAIETSTIICLSVSACRDWVSKESFQSVPSRRNSAGPQRDGSGDRGLRVMAGG